MRFEALFREEVGVACRHHAVAREEAGVAVVGMEPGQTKSTTIPADQAYGDRNDEMILTVDRSNLPDGMDPGAPEQ